MMVEDENPKRTALLGWIDCYISKELIQRYEDERMAWLKKWWPVVHKRSWEER